MTASEKQDVDQGLRAPARLITVRLSANTVKYNPLPSGDPLGFALGPSFTQRVIFDPVCFVLIRIQHAQSNTSGLLVVMK